MSEYTINAILQVVQAAFAEHFACKRTVNRVSTDTAVPDAEFVSLNVAFKMLVNLILVLEVH
jgi:hypothetical protein